MKRILSPYTRRGALDLKNHLVIAPMRICT